MSREEVSAPSRFNQPAPVPGLSEPDIPPVSRRLLIHEPAAAGMGENVGTFLDTDQTHDSIIAVLPEMASGNFPARRASAPQRDAAPSPRAGRVRACCARACHNPTQPINSGSRRAGNTARERPTHAQTIQPEEVPRTRRPDDFVRRRPDLAFRGDDAPGSTGATARTGDAD